jgi:hypothetical protein
MSHHIHILSKQYFQLVDVPQLSIPPNNVLIEPAVQEALYEQMFNESLTPLPPTTYRTRALKLLLARIEDGITDPEEDVRDSVSKPSTTPKTEPRAQLYRRNRKDILQISYLTDSFETRKSSTH